MNKKQATKAELVNLVAVYMRKTQNAPIAKSVVNAVFTALLAVMETALLDGKTIPLPNIGRLKTTRRAARKIYHPKTREFITISARRAVYFVPATRFKAKLINAEKRKTAR